MNIPYVKKFNKDGICINPIQKSYINLEPNRRERRGKAKPFYGQSLNYHLSVFMNKKFHRVKQVEFDKNGDKKIIEHYITD